MNVKPRRYDFAINAGASLYKKFTWRQRNPDGSQGAPYDITGYDARLWVPNPDGVTFAFELTVANGGIVLGGVAGTIEWMMTPTETSALDFGKLPYRFDITEPNGTVNPFLRGVVRLWKM